MRDLQLDPNLRRLALRLPHDGDLRSREFARQLRERAGSDTAYMEAVLKYYTDQPFYYTLRPPLLGERDTIDAFLFESRRGFCAHYAGSFVFLMRAAGIPARVVAGYQGGEWNPAGEYLQVRQYDAHAWTECGCRNVAGCGLIRPRGWRPAVPSRGWRRCVMKAVSGK
ncbi:MAG: transglutaminase family protein [Thiolinea sp.]